MFKEKICIYSFIFELLNEPDDRFKRYKIYNIETADQRPQCLLVPHFATLN